MANEEEDLALGPGWYHSPAEFPTEADAVAAVASAGSSPAELSGDGPGDADARRGVFGFGRRGKKG